MIVMKIPFVSKDDYQEPVSIEESYTELHDESQSPVTKIMIEKVDGLTSVDKIMRKVREGNIVIAAIRDLKEANTEELKHCILRMKTACMNLNGDIAGAGEEWIIITPSSAAIHRESQ